MNEERLPIKIMRVNNDARPLAFTFTAILLGMAAAGGSVAAVIYHPLWIVMAGGAFAGALMLYWRIVEHDRRAFSQRTYQPAGATAEPERVYQPVLHENDGQALTYGRYRFSSEQWGAIGKQIYKNNKRLSRDSVAKAKVFTNIKGQGVWDGIVKDFERMGWVNAGQLTPTGNTFFFAHVSPSPIQESSRRRNDWRAAAGGGDGGGIGLQEGAAYGD